MKKNRIFLSFLILILFTVFLSVTCKQNVGLGGTIDIERPEKLLILMQEKLLLGVVL